MVEVTQLPIAKAEPWHFPCAEADRVMIEGRLIPKLRARDQGDEVSIILDGRFCVDVPKELGRSVAWLVANALAIGQGYAYLGSESKDRPFAPMCGEFGGLPQ